MGDLLKLLCIISCLSSVLACDRPNTSLSPPPDPIDRTYQDASVSPVSSIFLEMGEPALSLGTSGPYRLKIREIDTDIIKEFDASFFIDEWPYEINLPIGLSGRYQLLAYLDSNNDQVLDDCPFPPSALDTESADELDNVQASVLVSLPSATTQTLTLKRRICGPGDINTGVEGSIEGLSQFDDLPIKALMEKGIENQTPETSPLRLTVLPFRGDTENSLKFSFGELLPGNYKMTLFIDNDDDNSPTPCSSRGGGADRGVSVAENIVVQDGQRVLIETPFVFDEPNCPEELTGFTGEVQLGASLDPSLTEVNSTKTDTEGEFWIQLARSDGSDTPTSLKILPTIKGRPNPLRYTVTGIEPGLWNVTAFLDRDDSNDFSPCNVVSGGLDVITGRLESIRVRENSIAEVGTIDLNALECGGESLSGIRGEVTIERETGPLGSGRPVLMRFYDSENTTTGTLLLFDNHNRVTGNFDGFVQKLAPGDYSTEIFVDTTANGTYESCDPDTYGDRYHSGEISIELDAGSLLDLGRIELEPELLCLKAEQTVRFRLMVEPMILAEGINQLNIWVRETGGWGMTSSVANWEEVQGEWLIEYGTLPPGDYTFSIYSDDDGNGSLSTCSSEMPDRYLAEFDLNLRSDMPYATPLIPLELQCD